MTLPDRFWKRFNGDVTGAGKSPLRKRFLRSRQMREDRKRGFLGIKKMQDRQTEQERIRNPVKVMVPRV